MSKRYDDAIHIQGGACNPIAIAGTLHKHCLEYTNADGHRSMSDMRRDPALRLICHQLAYLFGVWAIDDNPTNYAKLMQECRERVEA